MKLLAGLGVIGIMIVMIALSTRSTDWELRRCNDTVEKFSIEFPEDWKIKRMEPHEYLDTAYALIVRNPDGAIYQKRVLMFRDSITVKVEKLPPDWTPARYMAASVEFWKEAMWSFEIAEEGEGMLAGHDARWMTYNYEPGSPEPTVTVLVYTTITNGRAFTVICEMLAHEINERRDQLETIVASLRIEE